jgi:hypothetical protein
VLPPLKNRVIRDSAVQLGLTHQRGANGVPSGGCARLQLVALRAPQLLRRQRRGVAAAGRRVARCARSRGGQRRAAPLPAHRGGRLSVFDAARLGHIVGATHAAPMMSIPGQPVRLVSPRGWGPKLVNVYAPSALGVSPLSPVVRRMQSLRAAACSTPSWAALAARPPATHPVAHLSHTPPYRLYNHVRQATPATPA